MRFRVSVGKIFFVLVLALGGFFAGNAAAETLKLGEETQEAVQRVLQLNGEMEVLPYPKMDVPGHIQGIHVTEAGGDSYWAGIFLDSGQLSGLVALDALRRCGERYRQSGEDRFEPETDEATVKILAAEFLDRATTATIETTFESCEFDGQNSWMVVWRRHLEQIPFDEDILYVRVCDRTLEVVSFVNAFRSLLPLGDPPSGETPIPAMPSRHLASEILHSLNESYLGSQRPIVDIQFSDEGWRIVNPNYLFGSISVEQWITSWTNSRRQPSAYARIFRFRAFYDHGSTGVLGEVWVGMEGDEILGGALFM